MTRAMHSSPREMPLRRRRVVAKRVEGDSVLRSLRQTQAQALTTVYHYLRQRKVNLNHSVTTKECVICTDMRKYL